MKITEQERKRISKLYNLNETWDIQDSFDEPMGQEPDATDLSDAQSDEWVEKTFMDCLDTIHSKLGYAIERKEFEDMLDKYYSDSEKLDSYSRGKEDYPF